MKACVEPELNQTSSTSLDLLPLRQFGVGHEAFRKRSFAPASNQTSAPLSANAFSMRAASSSDLSKSRTRNDLIGFEIAEDGDRHAPGALARHDPIRPVRDHAGDAVFARLGHPFGALDFVERDVAKSCVELRPASAGAAATPRGEAKRERLIHRDEPLRRVAEDDRLLRAPRVRILMLQAAARDDVAGFGQRLDDGIIGVALVAVLLQHALAFEARRGFRHARRRRRR